MLRIIVPKHFKQWEKGALRMGVDLAAETDPWDEAARAFYDATQQVVHVVTGYLQRSGNYGVERAPRGPVAFVGYTAPYSQVEIDRGGDHDFMGRGWEMSQPAFQAAFGATWEKVIKSWQR
jgi:hypothetical protein